MSYGIQNSKKFNEKFNISGAHYRRSAMADKPDHDKMKGPGGLTMRELHELVKKSHARDQAASKVHNKLAQPQSRWQRFVRYVWDKNRGRG